MVKLSDVLNLKKQHVKSNESSYFTALILQSSNKQMAFIVDEVLGEHEGVVKTLGAQLKTCEKYCRSNYSWRQYCSSRHRSFRTDP